MSSTTTIMHTKIYKLTCIELLFKTTFTSSKRCELFLSTIFMSSFYFFFSWVWPYDFFPQWNILGGERTRRWEEDLHHTQMLLMPIPQHLKHFFFSDLGNKKEAFFFSTIKNHVSRVSTDKKKNFVFSARLRLSSYYGKIRII